MSSENHTEVTGGSQKKENSQLDSCSTSTHGLSLCPETIEFLSHLTEERREELLKLWKHDEEAGVVTEYHNDSDDSSGCMFWCGSMDSDGLFFCGGSFDDSNYQILSSNDESNDEPNSSTDDNQLGNELFLETRCYPRTLLTI